MTLSFTPIRDRIIIERSEKLDKTKGGLLLVEMSQEVPSEGTVIAVGSGEFTEDGDRKPMDTVVGDRVLFPKHGGTDIKLDGEEYIIMHEHEIYGILTTND